ncbi:hypothetical protein [Halorubrum halophilum]|nr:hypothetical protein [Halorubrum halophilum]
MSRFDPFSGRSTGLGAVAVQPSTVAVQPSDVSADPPAVPVDGAGVGGQR